MQPVMQSECSSSWTLSSKCHMLMMEKKNQGSKSGMTGVKSLYSVLSGSTISAELGVYFEFRTASETEFGI